VRRLTELLPRELQFLSSLTVNQVMSKDVMTILPETTVDEILNHMTTHHHMGYPVVDEEKRLVGIVTFEDVSKVAPDKRSTTYAQEIANKRLITMHPEDSVLDVYTKMIEKKIGRVLIVERDDPKRLVGIVTRTDVMHMFMWPMRLK
jgi:CIC family chloride channel protein